MKTRSILTARTALALAAAAALGVPSADAWALGLGRLSVQSALGETLRAEIDIASLSADEASSLKVQIASAEAYRNAGVEYNAVLASAQAAIVRRPDGRAYVRITTDRAIQEPFVDVIVELTWSTGRLVREFTLLIDPPAARPAPAAQAAAPVAPALAPAPAAAAPKPTPTPAPAVAATPPAAPVAPAARAAEPKPAAAAGDGADQYRVRQGDSLSRIAGRTQRPGVVLDQMLVGLFRSNPDAFLGANMNRLKSGVVLAVPPTDAVKAIPVPEARELIAAQSADFNAYRQRLAQGAPAAAAAEPARQARGKVQAAVEDKKQAAAASADKLKLSAPASAPEARVSKATEKKDSATRVAELTRNVEELKKLQEGTTAAKPGAKAPPAAAPASAPVAGPAVAVAPPVVTPPVVAPPPPPPPVASAPAAAVAPVTAAKPSAPEAKPSAPASALAAASAVRPTGARPTPPAPPPEPGFIESLMESPFALPGAGLLAIALAGLGYYKFRGRGAAKQGGETSFLESRVQPDSFFGASGGQRVDTTDQSGGTSSMGFSLSQLDAIGDVDPVAEADVYLAYGRDLQAEEILKEAMRSTPDRLAIRTKLLEVYAKRRDTKGFELLATQLYSLTQGSGPDWEKTQEMGRGIDPNNGLYQPGGRPPEVVRDGHVIDEPLNATTMPQSVMPSTAQFPAALEPTLPQPKDVDVDLDLELDSQALVPTVAEPKRAPPADAGADSSLDFDFGPEPPTIATKGSGTVPVRPAMDLNLADLSLDLDSAATIPVPPPAQQPQPGVGAYALSGAVPLGDTDATVRVLPEVPPIDENDPIARKIELAEEFRQIGDMEGARDLLEEVIAKSDGALKAKAERMLTELG